MRANAARSCLLLTLIFGAAASSSIAAPPNLVIVLLDDLGYADVGFNGCRDIPTPNLDRIASEGVRCTNAYVTHSVCGPSRAALITGRYQCRFGASRNPTCDPTVPNNGVPVTESNLAELLSPRGYRSIAIGKWHLGTHPELRPLARGFDEFFGFLTGGHDYSPERLTLEDLSEVNEPWAWYRTKLLRNETRVETDDYLSDELSDAAVDFVERHHDQPFFLYLAYNAPHTPLQATAEYLARFDSIQDPKRRTYAAMVSAVDDGVGRVLDKLSEHGLDEQTIVFFLSDNGGATNNSSRNTPLRGHKGSPFEGGVRVPFAVRWTGALPAGVDYNEPVSSMDIAGTIVSQAEATVAENKPLDGVDLIPHLTGADPTPPHEELYWRWYDQDRVSVRVGSEKLILMEDGKGRAGRGGALLYDLDDDLGETRNLTEARPDNADGLRRRLQAWEQELVEPIAPGLGSWKFPRK